MRTLTQTILLFFIIIIEGYIVLSTELLAIRQTVPYIGSGTDTISVIIAAILMPLAFGYQSGGQYKPQKIFGRFVSVRNKLIFNVCIAATFLFFGLSYVFIGEFFSWLSNTGIHSRVLQTSIFCILFMITPVYLLGQTVPLITNFFAKANLPKITGKILFFSTLGSFLGATLSTLVLMTFLGVHHTLSLNFVLMTILVMLLSKKTNHGHTYYMIFLTFLALIFNSDMAVGIAFPAMRANNQYNLIQAGTIVSGSRALSINGNSSSIYDDQGNKHLYVEFAEEIAILPILNANPPKDILIIGAGGFTFGHNDKNNHYTYVDIDKDLKRIAERYILQEPIGDNKKFEAKPARAFLYETKKKYDVIYLDAYLGKASVPEHLVTREFFIQVKNHLKDNGIVMANFIISPNFGSKFSRNLDNTFRSVFPHISRQAIADNYMLWKDDPNLIANVAYIYRNHPDEELGHIYTDNKNSVFYDKPVR